MNSTHPIEDVERLLSRVKPVNLIRLLREFFTARDHCRFVRVGVQILELYDLYWTFNSEHLLKIKDAFLYALRMIPTIVSSCAQFVKKLLPKQHRSAPVSERETVQRDLEHLNVLDDFQVPDMTLPDDFVNQSIGEDLFAAGMFGVDFSKLAKPLAIVGTLIITIGMIVGGGCIMSLTTIGTKVAKFISTTGQACKNSSFMFDGLKSMYTFVLNGIASVFGLEFDQPTTEKMKLVKTIREKIQAMKEFHDLCKNDMAKVMTNPQMFKKIEADVKSCSMIFDEIASSNTNLGSLRTLMDELRVQYDTLKEYHTSLIGAITGKQEPCLLWLYGNSGVGKSHFVHLLVNKLGEREGRVLTTYTRNPTDDFWSGYVGQDCVIYDDFGCSAESADQAELVSIYSENPYALVMAALNDKGMFFSSRYVIICSNFSHMDKSSGTKGLKDPTILWRRRDLLVRMHDADLSDYRATHHEMPPADHYKDDWSHVTFYRVGLDLDTNGKCVVMDTMSPDTIADKMLVKEKEKHDKFAKAIDIKLGNFKQGLAPPSTRATVVNKSPVVGCAIDACIPSTSRYREDDYDSRNEDTFGLPDLEVWTDADSLTLDDVNQELEHRATTSRFRNEAIDDDVMVIVNGRLPIFLLQGAPGTGKSFILDLLSREHQVDIIRTIEDFKEGSIMLIDEMGISQEFFEKTRLFVMQQYACPTVDKIVITCNAGTIDTMFTDAEQKDAFYRRLQTVEFSYRKKYALLPYSPLYTFAEAKEIGHAKTVTVKINGSKTIPINEVMALIADAQSDIERDIIYRSLMTLPKEEFSHCIRIKMQSHSFVSECEKGNVTSFMKAVAKGDVKLLKGKYSEVLSLATQVFGRMATLRPTKRQDVDSAFLYLNNAKDVAGTDATICIEFDDCSYFAVCSVTEPTFVCRRGNGALVEDGNDLFYATSEGTDQIMKPEVRHLVRQYADLTPLRDLDDRLRQGFVSLDQMENQAVGSIIELLPQIFPLTQFIDTACLLIKLSISGLAITSMFQGGLSNESYDSDDDHMSRDAYNAKMKKLPRSMRQVRRKEYDDDGNYIGDVIEWIPEAKRRLNDMYSQEAPVKQREDVFELERINFQGPSTFLSNMYPSEIEFEGRKFPTVEHAYQYTKCMRMCKKEIKYYSDFKTPYEIKWFGNGLYNFYDRDEWMKQATKLLRELIAIKFEDPDLRQKLIETDPEELVHSVRDRYWGSTNKRPGANVMGQLLMELRGQFITESDGPDETLGLKRHLPSRRFKTPSTKIKKMTVVKELDEPEMEHEVMTDMAARAVLDMVAHNTVFMIGNSDTVMCRGIMIRDHLGVTNAHAYEDKEEGDTITVRFDVNYSAVILAKNKKRDQLWFKVAKQCQTFRDITGHMLRGEDMKDLSGNQALLQTTTRTTSGITNLVRVIQLDALVIKKVANVDRDGIQYSGHCGAYAYAPIVTTYGDCGSPIVIMNNSRKRKLVGFHTAASVREGIGSLLFITDVPLDNETIEEEILISPRDWIKPGAEDLDGDETPHKNFKIVGRCWNADTGEPVKLFHPTQTHLYRSPLVKEGMPEFEPAVLSNFDKRKTPEARPYEDALDKWAHEQPEIEMDRLSEVVEQISNHLARTIKSRRKCVRILTKTEALNRCSELETSNPIFRKSSAGYPYSLLPGVIKKEVFLEQHMINDVPLYKFSSNSYGCRLSHDVDHLIDTARKGRPFIVFSGSLKDEPLKLKKIYDATATRSFAGSPLHYTIANRMYLHMAAAAISDCRDVLPPQIGINPRSTEWHHMFHRLAKVSDCGFDADYSKWDATIPRVVMEQLPLIYNRIYQLCDPSWKPVDDVIRYNLHAALHGPLITYYDYIVQCPGGQVSGQPNTAMDNCLVNMIFFYYVWTKLAEQHSPKNRTYEKFLEKVSYIVYGDDNVCTVSRDIQDWFNFATFKEVMAELNMTITSAQKDGSETKIKPLYEMTFLKRGFVRLNNLIVGPLGDESIGKMLCLTRLNKTHHFDLEPDRVEFDHETIAMTIASCLEESALKGRVFYDDMVDHLSTCADNCGVRVILWPTWSQKFEKVVYNCNSSS